MSVLSSWGSIHWIAAMTHASGASIGAWRNGIKRKWFRLTAARAPIRDWSPARRLSQSLWSTPNSRQQIPAVTGRSSRSAEANTPNLIDPFLTGDNNVTHRPDLLLCRNTRRQQHRERLCRPEYLV